MLGEDVDEFGVAEPFSSSGVSAPAVLTAASVSPFVVVVDPCVVVVGVAFPFLGWWWFDVPFALVCPAPFGHASFNFWQLKMLRIQGSVKVLVRP